LSQGQKLNFTDSVFTERENIEAPGIEQFLFGQTRETNLYLKAEIVSA